MGGHRFPRPGHGHRAIESRHPFCTGPPQSRYAAYPPCKSPDARPGAGTRPFSGRRARDSRSGRRGSSLVEPTAVRRGLALLRPSCAARRFVSSHRAVAPARLGHAGDSRTLPLRNAATCCARTETARRSFRIRRAACDSFQALRPHAVTPRRSLRRWKPLRPASTSRRTRNRPGRRAARRARTDRDGSCAEAGPRRASPRLRC